MSPKRTRLDAYSRALARHIASQATQRCITQSALADATGIPQGTISRVFAGQRAMTVTDLARLCDALGISQTAAIRAAREATGNTRQAPRATPGGDTPCEPTGQTATPPTRHTGA